MTEITATVNSYREQNCKLPVLIVCYLRPTNLEILLENKEFYGRKIYIFIDRCVTNQFALNEEVYQVASKPRARLEVEIFWSSENLGVANGVPAAIEWISKLETHFIILEDDCIPRDGALHWFDQKIHLVDRSLLMISGYSPAPLLNSGDQIIGLECKYPMIWGWATSADAWEILRPKSYSYFELLSMLLKSDRKDKRRLSTAFFIAAQIRVQSGKLKAWDAPMALNMLKGGHKSLIPTRCLIENIGTDLVASHEQIQRVQDRQSRVLTNVIDVSHLEKAIENEVYGMTFRNYFAPMRAILRL